MPPKAEHRLADVDQFGRALADDVHAQQLRVSRWKISLSRPDVAEDLAARDLAVLRLAHLVGHACLRELSSVRPTIEISGMV